LNTISAITELKVDGNKMMGKNENKDGSLQMFLAIVVSISK
jgi:hypothetical protein